MIFSMFLFVFLVCNESFFRSPKGLFILVLFLTILASVIIISCFGLVGNEVIYTLFQNKKFLETTLEKWYYFIGIYKYANVLVYPMSLLFPIFSKKGRNLLGIFLIPTLFISISFTLGVFLPIQYSYRLLIFSHPFNITLIASLLWFLLGHIINCHNINIARHGKKVKLGRRVIKGAVFLIAMLFAYSLIIQNYVELVSPKIVKLQERYLVFTIGEFIKHNTYKDALIICGTGGIWWYQAITAFYANRWIINLWIGDKYHDEILKQIYLANTSEEAYSTIVNLLKNPIFVVMYNDPQNISIRRYYKVPNEVILLYDDCLARYFKAPKSPLKFFDSRFFTVLKIFTNKYNERFYIIRVNLSVYNNTELKETFELPHSYSVKNLIICTSFDILACNITISVRPKTVKFKVLKYTNSYI